MLSMNYHIEKSDYTTTPLHVRLAHDKREIKTKNKIFESENDFWSCEELSKLKNMNDYKEFFKSESERLDKLVFEKIKQKNQTKLNIIEGVLSISKEDFEKMDIQETIENLKKYYEKEGVKLYSIFFHCDEGHIDPITKEKQKNYHFHIIHSNITNEGKSFTKKKYKAKHGLSLVQDELSEVIGVDRGKKKSQTNRKHINYTDYKEMKKRESEELLQEIEKIKKVSSLELEKRIKLIKTFDIDIEKFFVFFEKEQYYKIKKSNLDNLINFHKVMIESYKEINEYNTLMTILKTKLEKVKDIKDLEKLEKETKNIKENLEILEPYHKELSEKIEKQKKELEQYETLKSEINILSNKKDSLEIQIPLLEKKVYQESQKLTKLEEKIQTLTNTNNDFLDFLEEKRKKEIQKEKEQEEQRKNFYQNTKNIEIKNVGE